MSDAWNEDDENGTDTTGAGLRAQLKDFQKKLAAAEKRAGDAEKILAVGNASTFLKSKGYPEALARHAANDGVDIAVTADLEKWLTENSTLFAPPSSTATDATAPVLELTPEQQAAAAAVVGTYDAASQLRAVATAPDGNKFAATLAAIPKTATGEEVLETLRSAGL